jgi:hypothetical protein
MKFFFLIYSLFSTLKNTNCLRKIKKIYCHLLILSYSRNTLHVSISSQSILIKKNLCSVYDKSSVLFGNLFFMTSHLSFIVLIALSFFFFFFLFNVDVRVSMRAPRLIPWTLKLMTI